MTSWAHTIAELDAAKRGSATFGPYLVDPDGALRLPIEMLTRSGPGTWPVSEAPGWSVLALPDGTNHRQWLPLGSEYFFRGEQPAAAYAPSSHPLAGTRTGGLDALRAVLRGDAFPFASRFFALPSSNYIMNSFVYHPQDMEDLSVFIGYRGHSRRFDEVVTPGIYRKHNQTSDGTLLLSLLFYSASHSVPLLGARSPFASAPWLAAFPAAEAAGGRGVEQSGGVPRHRRGHRLVGG